MDGLSSILTKAHLERICKISTLGCKKEPLSPFLIVANEVTLASFFPSIHSVDKYALSVIRL